MHQVGITTEVKVTNVITLFTSYLHIQKQTEHIKQTNLWYRISNINFHVFLNKALHYIILI